MIKWIGILSVSAVVIFGASCFFANAHDAPSGWSYPANCCSGIDCRQVASKAIGESTKGYVILKTGEVIPYHDHRLKDSPDGAYHWCSQQGLDTTPTVCLFVPPPGV